MRAPWLGAAVRGSCVNSHGSAVVSASCCGDADTHRSHAPAENADQKSDGLSKRDVGFSYLDRQYPGSREYLPRPQYKKRRLLCIDRGWRYPAIAVPSPSQDTALFSSE